MAENTKIEWATHTFNPWEGCQKVGPGCDNCYAEARDKRFTGGTHWGPGTPRRLTSTANWNKPLKWDRDAAKAVTRPRVFCASLADVFDNEVSPHWRAELVNLISKSPNLDWLLLTKRIGNAAAMLEQAIDNLSGGQYGWDDDRRFPHVWIGATICNQVEADRDIPKLLALPAAVRFLSIEPMLGPIDLTDITTKFDGGSDHFSALYDPEDDCADTTPYVDWVIVGGESGSHARPIDRKSVV